MNSKLIALFALPALVACGGGTSEIDDPQMEATAAEVGSESAELATISVDATESEVQGQVRVVGSGIQGLVGQHQAYAATSIPSEDLSSAMRIEGETVQWDGERLVVNWTYDEAGFDFTYGIDLTITTHDDGGTTIDGRYDIDYTLAVAGTGTSYVVSAQYNSMKSNAEGCAVSGNLDITYDLDVTVAGLGIPGSSGTSQSGHVIVEFLGCDNVVVSGS